MNQLSENIGALELSDVPAYVHDAVLETSAGFADVGPSDSCIPRTIIKGTPGCPRIDGELETASFHAAVGPTQSLKGAGGQRC